MYCQNIDKAILKGYNKNLELIAEKREQVFEKAVKDWFYHTAHLYHTLQKVIVSELEAAGKKVMERAETDFAAHYDQQRLKKIKEYF